MKLKNKILAALLGLSMLLCSCADSSSAAESSITSSSRSETVTSADQSSQSEQTTTTAEPVTTEQTTTTADPNTTEQTTSKPAGTPDASVPAGVPMWEGTDKNGSKIIFMGSMHVAKADFYPLPEKIKKAYDQSEVIAFECDTESAENEQMQFELQKQMTYRDGTLLKDKLSPQAYKILCERFAEIGMSEEMIANFKPWAAYETLTALWIMSGELKTQNGVDYYLMRQTKTDNKQLYELESAQSQLDMMIQQPDKLYDALFRLMKDESKQSALDDTAKLYELWLKGDMKGIEEMTVLPPDEEMKKEGLTDEEIRLLRQREKTQVDDRNIAMAEKIKTLFKSGKSTMVIVGSAHFIGENGIISLLEKDGCTFRRI